MRRLGIEGVAERATNRRVGVLLDDYTESAAREPQFRSDSPAGNAQQFVATFLNLI